jgi:serine/threonine protein kinase
MTVAELKEAKEPKEAKEAKPKKEAHVTSVRGKRLGRYQLLEHLAGGGMAEIYLARREEGGTNFSKELVLKVLQQRFADNPQIVAMFHDEARLSAGLRHPNIVDVYDVGEDDGVRFIAMEYIEGRTLTDVITRSFEVGLPLPRGLAVHVVAEIAAGLSYLQDGLPGRGRAPGIIHRDISPTNIVLGWAGQTKIIDFGIAQRGQGLVTGKTSASKVVPRNPKAPASDGVRPGKVSYMSPEQVRGELLDARSDQFSLGTILYEITLGQRLWRGPAEVVMQRIVEEAPPPPSYVDREYPPALERIVLRTLEKRAQDRYPSAGELVADLDRFLIDAGLPRESRVLGDYVRSLYAPGAKVSEGGARRAAAFQGDDQGEDAPVVAPLDFDRPVPVKLGSGAALAHALRGAQPFELAADATSSAAIGMGATAPENSGLAPFSGKTPPPLSLRTPPPVSLRNAGLSPDAGSSLGTIPAEPPSAMVPAPASSSGTTRAILLGVFLTILLAGLFFVLRTP